MIPTLLWQCPLCHTNDALRQQQRWFRLDTVDCTNCRTVWEVQRMIGEDFRLEVIHGAPSATGSQMPLAQWYDLVKGGLEAGAPGELFVVSGC
jgi:hypothetical protein